VKLVYLWAVVLLILGMGVLGVLLVRASGLKRRDLFIRDIFLVVVAPVMLFIAFIELVVVPSKGSQYASSIYPIFICWVAPAMFMLNRRLKIYFA
jgi:hypothetical protein